MNFESDRKRVADTARFDDSFAAHMIRDFFFVLVAVVVIELSVRFVLVVYDFHHNQQTVTRTAAERLASDVKSIMLNSGGPVAARTVYPILERNHEELVTRAEHLAARHDGLSVDLNDISNSLYEFRHFLEEMAVLEEKMRSIAAQGQTLLHRLKNVDENPQRDAAPSAAATS